MNQIIIEKDVFNENPVLSLKEKESDTAFIFGKNAARLLLQALSQEPDFLEKFVNAPI
jgi:hypothetical protein